MSALDAVAGEWYLRARRGIFPAAQPWASRRLHFTSSIDAKNALRVYDVSFNFARHSIVRARTIRSPRRTA